MARLCWPGREWFGLENRRGCSRVRLLCKALGRNVFAARLCCSISRWKSESNQAFRGPPGTYDFWWQGYGESTWLCHWNKALEQRFAGHTAWTISTWETQWSQQSWECSKGEGVIAEIFAAVLHPLLEHWRWLGVGTDADEAAQNTLRGKPRCAREHEFQSSCHWLQHTLIPWYFLHIPLYLLHIYNMFISHFTPIRSISPYGFPWNMFILFYTLFHYIFPTNIILHPIEPSSYQISPYPSISSLLLSHAHCIFSRLQIIFYRITYLLENSFLFLLLLWIVSFPQRPNLRYFTTFWSNISASIRSLGCSLITVKSAVILMRKFWKRWPSFWKLHVRNLSLNCHHISVRGICTQLSKTTLQSQLCTFTICSILSEDMIVQVLVLSIGTAIFPVVALLLVVAAAIVWACEMLSAIVCWIYVLWTDLWHLTTFTGRPTITRSLPLMPCYACLLLEGSALLQTGPSWWRCRCFPKPRTRASMEQLVKS